MEQVDAFIAAVIVSLGNCDRIFTADFHAGIGEEMFPDSDVDLGAMLLDVSSYDFRTFPSAGDRESMFMRYLGLVLTDGETEEVERTRDEVMKGELNEDVYNEIGEKFRKKLAEIPT
jgi:hypothetical protein